MRKQVLTYHGIRRVGPFQRGRPGSEARIDDAARITRPPNSADLQTSPTLVYVPNFPVVPNQQQVAPSQREEVVNSE